MLHLVRIAVLLVVLAACAAPRGTAEADVLPKLTASPAGVIWQGAALSGKPDIRPAPILRWWVAARDTGLAGTALLVPLADSLVARGDTLRADSLLAAPRLARSLWAWEAVRRRAAWALAKGEASRAARLLDDASRSRWAASEEAAWRAARAPLHLRLRDTVSGEALARSVLEDHVNAAPASGTALALLDTLARFRHESFALPLARRAALAEWANGRRAQALARNAQVLRLTPTAERAPDLLLRIQWYRDWRRPLASLAVSDTALRLTRGTPEFEQVRLERARSFRSAGKPDSALLIYQRVGRAAEDGVVRATAWWECAREAQDESRWELAAKAFRHADSLGRQYREATSTVRGAATLAGLMDWMLGRHDAAIVAWRASGDRRARFWLGVALRRRGLAEGDSILLAEFALKPGYDLLSVAARDTLGLPSWRGQVAVPQPDSLEPQLVAAIVSLSGPLQLPEAAARIVAARDRNDPRLARGPRGGIAASSWRAIALASYAGGDLAGATRAADRVLLSAGADSALWEWVPWAFPPAFERELIGAADLAGVERALLWALARQESRFDPRAVSRSSALGLTQLLPGTAREVAKELKEQLPSDSLLFEPDRGLRYGAHYLKKLLKRFDGAVPVALTAYNAGPSKVRTDWRQIVQHGGWALYCEMAANADTQDYVRRILGYRQAYRELRPTGAVTR